MPVVQKSNMENNERKRANTFTIEALIGKDANCVTNSPCEQARSRSPSISPLSRKSSHTYEETVHSRRSSVTSTNPLRLSPYGQLASIEYQRNLASLSLLNQSLQQPVLPPAALFQHLQPQLPHQQLNPYTSAFVASHPRETHLFPWLLGRTDHVFGPRFPVHDGGLLLQPFRKSKRIRTAFSPSQLLKLEQSFDKNHYVVGQERKELASKLTLTETQVKVWFQNRRTKYKRLKYEEGGEKSPLAGTSTLQYDEDDLEIEDNDSIADETESSQIMKNTEDSPHNQEMSVTIQTRSPLEEENSDLNPVPARFFNKFQTHNINSDCTNVLSNLTNGHMEPCTNISKVTQPD